MSIQVKWVVANKLADPRVLRTRRLLQQALFHLLQTKNFDTLSVQDIADAATVNRATFYDHYNDKFGLLECMVASHFQRLILERGISYDSPCAGALRALSLSVCDYLAGLKKSKLDPHMESAVITVIRRTLFDGLARHPPAHGTSPELVASTAAWALYGAAREWLSMPDRPESEDITATITALVSPILSAG